MIRIPGSKENPNVLAWWWSEDRAQYPFAHFRQSVGVRTPAKPNQSADRNKDATRIWQTAKQRTTETRAHPTDWPGPAECDDFTGRTS